MEVNVDPIARQKPANTPHGIRFWLRAARAISFPLSMLPICIGAALGISEIGRGLLVFALALLGGIAAHAGTNLMSDYNDFVKGVDRADALSSHTGALIEGLAGSETIRRAGLVCFAVTVCTGVGLLGFVGWSIVLFGIAGIAGGFMYTGGPFAWKYAGLGEVATGFLMGPLMTTGSYFTQTRSLAAAPIILSLAIGFFVSAVSLANNIRDVFVDSRAGVVTMPQKTGAKASAIIFRILLLAPFALALITIALDIRFLPVLAVFFVFPKALKTARGLKTADNDFASLSRQAARRILPLQVIKLHQAFCLCLLAGCIAVRLTSL